MTAPFGNGEKRFSTATTDAPSPTNHAPPSQFEHNEPVASGKCNGSSEATYMKEKPTSALDTEVLLGRNLSRHFDVFQRGNMVVVKPKRLLPSSIFFPVKRKILEMGGRYVRGKQEFQIPLEEK